MDTDVGDLTVLFASDDEFLRCAESRPSGGFDGLEAPRTPTPENTLERLDDRQVDCVVVDEDAVDDLVGFVRRLRDDYPDLPIVVLVDRPSADDYLAIGGEAHTEVLWRRGGPTPLDELKARVATAVGAARNGPAGGRTDRSSARDAKIEALHGAATNLAACHTEAEVYEETVAAAERILEFDVCCTMIYDGEMLRPEAVSSGAPSDGARPMRPDEGEAGYVFTTGESKITHDTTTDDVSDPAKETYRSGLSVPIGDVGVFQAVATATGAFSESDLEAAELLLSHAETALDRIRFDEVLQRERDRFRALIEHSSDLVTVLDRDGTIKYQSPSLEHLLGYDPEEAVGDDVYEYIHPEDRDRVRERFERVIEDTHAGISVEYRVRHADGGWRVVESNGSDYLDDPAVEGFVVNSRDVTERKERLRILEELPAAAGDLRAAETMEEVAEITIATAGDVLELPITGMWLYDDAETVLRPAAYTPESEALFGDHPTFTPEGGSLSWEAFETGEARIYDDVPAEEEVHNPETAVRSEMIFPLGRYGVINVGTTERETFSDVDVYFAHILAATAESALERLDHERTLRRQQRELERQNERLDTFASLVSHDLRNPLSVAKGYAELLEEAESVDEVVEFGAEIGSALDRMETLVQDVLALARDGRTIGNTEPVDLSGVAESAWRSLETGDADLVTPADGTFLADEDRLMRLLENLVRNAIEHADADRVRIGTIQTDGEVSGFFVEDDGPGIPEADRERVFETEFTTATDGTGFGLSIVQQIADAHGWSVAVTEGSTGGARFEVTGVRTT